MTNYKLASTKKILMEMLGHIDRYEYLAYDVESTGLNVRTSKIIGFAVTGAIGEGYYFPIYEWNVETQTLDDIYIEGVKASNMAANVVRHLLGKKLIIHNSSYDIQITLNDLGVDLLPYLFIDTILLVHTVREEGSFALKDIAVSIQDQIGFDVESVANEEQIALKENVKKNGGAVSKGNFELYKADLNAIWPYAVKDVDLTLRVCKHYWKKLIQEGLQKFFFEEEVMPLLREVTIPMEQAGVLLDMDYIRQVDEEITKDIETYREKVVEALKKIPAFRKWVMETALKVYPPSNKGIFAQAIVKHYGLDLPVSEKTGKYILTKNTLESLPDSDIKYYLITGEENLLPVKDGVVIAINLWKEHEGGLVNIRSNKQLGEIAFHYMKIKPLSKTEKGAYQFNDELIDRLAEKHSWAKDLKIFNKLVKIKSSYVDRYLERNENGRYYFYYKQHGTISGRYASDAQQLPRKKEEGELEPVVLKHNNSVRAFFIPDPEYIFIDCDYETLEPRVFAHVTADKGLIDIFLNGWDFYSTIAIETEKIPGVSADKKADNYLGKVNKPARQKAKAYCLGIPYGMSAYALGLSIGVAQKDATELVEGYLSGFPELRNWMDRSAKQAKELGYIKTQLGRIRHLNKVKEVYDLFGDSILNWDFRRELLTKYESKEVQDMYMDYKNGLNNSRNFQIQGLAASIVNRAMIEINREFKRQGIDGKVVAQIHDQIIAHVKKDQSQLAKDIVKDKMENTTKLSLPLPAPPEIAINWRDGHT
jgi:DNA polymerase I-like protein with 3'-5' exonuclease and polymerase domains